jgi:hypothetical protein
LRVNFKVCTKPIQKKVHQACSGNEMKIKIR